MHKRLVCSIVLGVAGGFLAGLAATQHTGSQAVASSSNPAELVSPTYYINATFRNFGFNPPAGTCLFLQGSFSVSYAEISFPDAATLTSLRLDGSNNNQDVNTNFVTIERTEVATCTTTTVATLALNEGFSNTFRESAINHTVNNADYVYRLKILVPAQGSVTIRRVRVGYTTSTALATCPGDNNGDGNINGSDLSVLLANFGTSCP